MAKFGSAVSRIDERLPGATLPLLSVSQTRGVIRRSELTDKPPRAATLDIYKVCRRGDIVFNKMSIRSGALGVAAEDGLVTYHYEVMRPAPGTDARYIAYLMKSKWFTGELIARERGIGAGDQGGSVRTTEVPFKVLRTIDTHLLTPSGQRTIADYLDRETAQIDTLIAKQEQLIATLRERQRARVAAALVGDWPKLPIRRLVTDIRQGWSPNCEPDSGDGVTEWAVLKLGCSNTGQFRWRQNKRLPGHEEPRPELAIRRGEVIVSRANTRELVGSASVVEGDYPRLMLSDLTYGLSSGDHTEPAFLAVALGSPAVRHQISSAAKGTSPSMQKISQRDLLSLELPHPPLEVQRELVRILDDYRSRSDLLIEKAERFIELSKERRSALITAAVTGQVPIASMSE